jgi:hypothetical protein
MESDTGTRQLKRHSSASSFNLWREFLTNSPRSFIVLGCMDRQAAYAIPTGVIEKTVDNYTSFRIAIGT